MSVIWLVVLMMLMALTGRTNAESERALVARIAGRDDKALAALYDQYAGLLYSVVVAIVKKSEDAEDVLQEIFVQIWHKASTFDTSRESVYAWLVTLARNRAIDRIRSKGYRTAQQEVAEPIPEISSDRSVETPLDAAIMEEQAGQIRQALQQIPTEQREVIEMAYFEGYSQAQMADRLELPLGTVKTRVRQGMKKLHDLLVDRP